MATKTKKTSKKGNGTAVIYQMVTDKIVQALEEGTVPWHRPWRVEGGVHMNLKSKRPYRGGNQFVLDIVAMTEGYTSPYWLTYKQAEEMGGQVRKGEKSTFVYFFKPIKITTDEKDKEGNKVVKTIPLLRYYRVFNAEQVDGIEEKLPKPDEKEREFKPIEICERMLKGMPNPPKLSHGGDRAVYSPDKDAIRLPGRKQFDSPEAYYLTSFHEHAHSTGHKKRLGRVKSWTTFGSDPYAKEELVAEMASAMLASLAGVEIKVEQTAAYIQSWIKRFKEDKKLLVSAGAQAQRACDYILDELKEEEKGGS